MIYLDYAASNIPYKECIELFCSMSLNHFGNPGAIHTSGNQARAILNRSRKTLAGLLGVRDREIFFTSGGTEANNWAVLLGCCQGHGREILVGATEHKSVLASARAMERRGFRVRILQPDRHGIFSPESVSAAVTSDTAMICIQAVNNETGVIQDVAALSRVARQHRVPFLCDAVQSFGHVAQDLSGADLISLSAHKFGGPRGVGCLVIRQSLQVQPLLHGGGQELGLRSGTENLPAIAAMARAAELSAQQLASESLRLVRLKTLFLSKLKEISADIEDNAPVDQTHPGILNCYFPGISAEELTVRLDAKGICVSPGAACSARDSEPSHVLRAMGYSPERAGQSLRFSFGRSTTQDEILQTASAIADILHPRKER